MKVDCLRSANFPNVGAAKLFGFSFPLSSEADCLELSSILALGIGGGTVDGRCVREPELQAELNYYLSTSHL